MEVSRRDDVIDCARGVQVCEGRRWGACAVAPALGFITLPAPDPALPSSTGLRLQSVGGSSDNCTDNVCNPYCKSYTDAPAVPYEASRVDVPTGHLSGGSLLSSNLPSSFKSKGSLDAQCSSPTGSEEWNEACQFDQHCVNGKCVAFTSGASGSCTGVDITSPTSCIPPVSGYRDMTVCNRGTASAPAGINCYRYPGGSPQYPNSDPGLGTLVMTTTKALAGGDCETQQVAESFWGQNGIQSVTCNPLDVNVVTVSDGPRYPAAQSPRTGMLSWTAPENAAAADAVNASASPGNPSGVTTGPNFPSASRDFSTDLSWSNASRAYASTPAGSFATVTPAAPAVVAGSLGPNYPGSFTTPAASGDTSFSNPTRANTADGSSASATPSNPTSTVVSPPSSNDGSASWNNLNNTYLAGLFYATATRSSAGTSDGTVSGFGLNPPAGAIIDSLQISVKWKTDLHNNKYSLSAQAQTGAANTAIGSALSKSGTYTTETTDSLTISGASLSGLTATDFSDANFKVRLRFQRSSGNVATSTASVDQVTATLSYHLPNSSASVVYQNFNLGSVPSSVSAQLSAEVKWKTSAVNANFALGMQVYTDYGLGTQATLGSEVTRAAADTSDHVDSTASLTVSGAQLASNQLGIRIRATRTAGGANPDVTALVDYVRVSVSWTSAGATTTHSVFFQNFGLAQLIPANATIVSVATTAHWNQSVSNQHATLGLQAHAGAGTTPLGSEAIDSTGPTTDTALVQTVNGGVTAADLSDANFGVRVRLSRDGSSSANPDFTAYLDYVSVSVVWTSAGGTNHGVSYGNFGFAGLPSGATVTGIKTEARWNTSVSSARAALGFQVYLDGGATALGNELVVSSPPTSPTTVSQTLSNLSLTPAALADGSFLVQLRVTRSAGSNNPNFTAYLDYVRVTLTYDYPHVASVAECNGSNNWSATKLSPSPDSCRDMGAPQYVPFTVTRVFQGVCATGGPTWRNFTYTASTPADTKVEFRFRAFPPAVDGTCSALPALTSGVDPAPLATASLTGDHPEVCVVGSASAGCPVDLLAGLGDTAATAGCLQMDAYGTPSLASTPQLLDWHVQYDCPPNQ